MNDRWLITGAAGRFGFQMCRHLSERGAEVTALRHRHPVGLPGVREIVGDLADPVALDSICKQGGYSYLVHAAGLTDVDACEQDPDFARYIHVEVSRRLATAAHEAAARFVYISTDHLWDGTRGCVDENEPPKPINIYAQTKLEGERAAVEANPTALIVRTNFFGKGRAWRPSFSDWIDATLRKGGPLSMFADVFFSPIAMELLCPIVDEIATRDASGIFNVAGRDRLSKYEFAMLYAQMSGASSDGIEPASIADVTMRAPRPRDMSLASNKVEAFLGRPMPTCRESIAASLDRANRQTLSDDGRTTPPTPPSRPLNYGRQHIDERDIAAVTAVLKSDFLTQGPTIQKFEDAVAERVGARHAVAVSSGTAALHIACLAAGLGKGDAGIAPTLTFIATANAIDYCGADVVLCDVDPQSIAIDPAALSAALEQHPGARAVMTVDFAGLAVGSERIRALAGNRIVIEDAAHALGATYEDGQPVGSCAYADMTVFSLHPVKSITSGEGGIVTTNDDEIARQLRILRNHGIEREADHFVGESARTPKPWYYEQQSLGFNYRLSDIHAALGLSQLERLDSFVARRRELALRYDRAFKNCAGISPYHTDAEERARSSHHLYFAAFDFAALRTDRARFMQALRARGINTQVHYIPVHRHPYHRERLGCVAEDFPGAETYYASCLSLPLYADLTDNDADYVITTVMDELGVKTIT